ncbi:MAG TPA: NAD(P)-dependent alcohol dehydrogenase [Ktedonobacteraceae bacterium]|jgi:NADPH:quinone reductase-like Zn-dependent oxidoreductase
MMKSYHANKGAGLASLALREHDVPVPGPHEVLVRVRAASFNYRELAILWGTYPLPIKPDVVPLSDGAGEIVAIGEGVTRAKIGDRVAAAPIPLWTDGPFGGWDYAAQIGGSLDGLLTEYALLNEEWIVHVPDHLSFEEAAALPTAGITAWNALNGAGSLQAGETVLTLGSGGVSLFTLQFAKLFGARVIATTSSEEKAQRLRAIGADEVVNYRTTLNWHEVVRELTNGRGVDHVVESTSPGTLDLSIKATATPGRVTLVGWLPSDVSQVDIGAFFFNLVTLRPIFGGNRAHFIAMNEAIAQSQLRPIIDRVFPFEDAKAAYRYYEEAQPLGKVIISQG